MNKKLIEFNTIQRSKTVPELKSGDVVKVYRKIVEGGKERTQMFQGMVIAIRGGQSASPMITVRKVSLGVGVEIVFPLYSPNIDRIEVVKRTRARRAKLFYVRTKSARVLGKKLKEVVSDVTMLEAEPLLEDEAVAEEQSVSSEEVIAEETPEVSEKEAEKS